MIIVNFTKARCLLFIAVALESQITPIYCLANILIPLYHKGILPLFLDAILSNHMMLGLGLLEKVNVG